MPGNESEEIQTPPPIPIDSTKNRPIEARGLPDESSSGRLNFRIVRPAFEDSGQKYEDAGRTGDYGKYSQFSLTKAASATQRVLAIFASVSSIFIFWSADSEISPTRRRSMLRSMCLLSRFLLCGRLNLPLSINYRASRRPRWFSG